MCSNPFGLVDKQRILQCSDMKCAEQYCNSCVRAIRGSRSELPFVCMTCRKDVTPTRSILIEEHIIWKSMCKTYGTQDLLDLKENSNDNFAYPILRNIQLRLIHLKSRSDTLQSLLDADDGNLREEQKRDDRQLIDHVNNLCMSLNNLIERLKETQQDIELRSTLVENLLKEYRKYMKDFDQLCSTSTDTAAVSDDRKEQIKQAFRMDRLKTLSFRQTGTAVNDILEDIDFRERCLLGAKVIMLSSQNTLFHDRINEIEKKLEKISTIKEELNSVNRSLQSLQSFTDEYDILLRHDEFPGIPCSKFILLLEMMRVRTEKIEISNNFPRTTGLMRAWKNDYRTDGEFNPKVISLFQAIELDVQHLFKDSNWVYSLSYKIGVIGSRSVGKSALIINLAELATFSSMISFERSTFGYLQFDTRVYEDPNNNSRIIPITFVDIEGATDNDESESTGNYHQIIKKADCDVYIIVFDNFFSRHNKTCQEYVENELKRKCLLVRSKADELFNKSFRDLYGTKYEKACSTEYQTKVTLRHIAGHALKTFDDQRLKSTVYLTAAVCEDNFKNTSFADFDLKALKKKLVKFAMTDVRDKRICNLAIRTAATVINTCFRRGYVVSQAKYKWLSAGASIIPFLNELPAFFGREKIRQVFGINDNCTATNYMRGTNNAFEEYLVERELTVPKEDLKSGEFKYLIAGTIEHTAMTPLEGRTGTNRINRTEASNWIKNRFETVARPVSTTLITVAPFLSGAVAVGACGLLTVNTTAAVLLTSIYAAWSFYSTGQRMNTELHTICDDLVVILRYFINDRCTAYCPNLQLPLSLGSSSDSDDE